MSTEVEVIGAVTSRERVLKAMQHKETDRVPLDLGGTESSGLTAEALFNLGRHLEIPCEIKVFEPYQYVAYVGDALKERFRIDTANLTPEPRRWARRAHPGGFDVLLPSLWHEETADDGATVIRRADGQASAVRPAGGHYFDAVNPPLRGVSKPAELEPHRATLQAFDLPAFADETAEAFRRRALALQASGACTVFNLCCHFLAAGQILRGYEDFMADLLTNEKLVRALLDILLEGYCGRVDRMAPLVKDAVDVVLLNDDLGAQQGPMLAPSTYRRLIKPYQREFFGYVKQAFGKPILFHSCGSVRAFIPDLIEVGVDALNPVQVSAAGMDLRELKHEFGRELTFWGGGIDTQSVLNSATPAEVKDAVRRSVDILAPGGGFVFCQVHNLQPDVPPANIVAMFAALDEYGNSSRWD